MIGNLWHMLKQADKENYAVPAFNYSDIWDLLAILDAAEEKRSPVIIASNPLVAKQIGIEICGAFGHALMQKAKIEVVHHLDHSTSVELCRQAIANKYPSVMIDASKYDLATNISMVNAVVLSAHKINVHVEAEIGRIRGMGIEGEYSGDDFLVQVDEAVDLVEKTNIDSLAIGIGTAHGFYQGKPEINFKRLQEIDQAVRIPLVLHGGTGIPHDDIRQAIALGINKVNIGTIIHCTYMNNMREELINAGPNPYTLDVVRPVMKKIGEVVSYWIDTCGSASKSQGGI
ncbi:MAG: class II fructose-bisphosphate aldolase [Bacillota bacterium]|nr:class II fructose-bisphosphate aldolase [Bacillota bacterium]